MINKMIEEMKLFKETQLVLDHKKDYKLCKNKSNYACAYYDCGKCIADEMIKIAEKYKAQEQCFELIKWERDCAISQLEELGTSLGEKPEIAKQRILEQRWILFEEKEPEQDSDCLILVLYKYSECSECKKFHKCNRLYESCDNYYYDYEANISIRGEYSDGHEIAWMPIPEYLLPMLTKKVGGAE